MSTAEGIGETWWRNLGPKPRLLVADCAGTMVPCAKAHSHGYRRIPSAMVGENDQVVAVSRLSQRRDLARERLRFEPEKDLPGRHWLAVHQHRGALCDHEAGTSIERAHLLARRQHRAATCSHQDACAPALARSGDVERQRRQVIYQTLDSRLRDGRRLSTGNDGVDVTHQLREGVRT